MNWKKWFGYENEVKEKIYVFENEAALQIKILYDAYLHAKKDEYEKGYVLWKAIAKYIPEVEDISDRVWCIENSHLRVYVGKSFDNSIKEMLKEYEAVFFKDVK